jgi:hypothetical protein
MRVSHRILTWDDDYHGEEEVQLFGVLGRIAAL